MSCIQLIVPYNKYYDEKCRHFAIAYLLWTDLFISSDGVTPKELTLWVALIVIVDLIDLVDLVDQRRIVLIWWGNATMYWREICFNNKIMACWSVVQLTPIDGKCRWKKMIPIFERKFRSFTCAMMMMPWNFGLGGTSVTEEHVLTTTCTRIQTP